MSRDARITRNSIKLTPADRAVLDSYASMLDGFAEYFGNGYEFVLHSLETLEHSVVKIVNGHLTGRSVGAPVTDLALSMLAKLESEGDRTHVSYRGKTKRGEPLYSSTIAIKGEHGRVIGLLCINFYLNTPLHQVFTNLFGTSSELSSLQENFAANVMESIGEAVEVAKRQVDSSSVSSATLRNKQIVTILYEQGVFQLKGAVPAVADMLGLSRNTVYMHLRQLQG